MDVAMMMGTLKLVGIDCNIENFEKVKFRLEKSEVWSSLLEALKKIKIKIKWRNPVKWSPFGAKVLGGWVCSAASPKKWIMPYDFIPCKHDLV